MLFSNINIDMDLIYFGEFFYSHIDTLKCFCYFYVCVSSLTFIWYNFIVIYPKEIYRAENVIFFSNICI